MNKWDLASVTVIPIDYSDLCALIQIIICEDNYDG